MLILIVMARMFAELNDVMSEATIVGCSTSGEIAQDHVRDKSITCLAIQLETGSFCLNSAPIKRPEDSFQVGKELISKFESEDLKGVLVLSDGLNTNGSELAKGISENIDPTKTKVSGGLAGDGNDFKQTWVFHSGKLQQVRCR